MKWDEACWLRSWVVAAEMLSLAAKAVRTLFSAFAA
jgi:hypothetical protein